ncbi:protein of unknown function [Pararobbsia alpina]
MTQLTIGWVIRFPISMNALVDVTSKLLDGGFLNNMVHADCLANCDASSPRDADRHAVVHRFRDAITVVRHRGGVGRDSCQTFPLLAKSD